MFKTLTLSAAALCVAATPILAAPATATTDLNLRAGPGPEFEVIGVIAGMDQAEVEGCIEEGAWCQVTYNGQTGWAHRGYLSGSATEATKVTTTRTVTYMKEGGNEGAGAAAGAVTGGALAGALIGGPAAIAAGVVLGANAGSEAVPEPETRTVTYVTENPVAPVYLDGEVVLGAGIPEDVEIYSIPESEYSYLNVNGQDVLVRDDRTIVYIYR
ncbi:SH3 domain-containing protein [Vannielia sp. SX4]|uniref:SH3 domain-containing protein n=1 Tax=Vannielia sp. SX4 TaxID=3463852 RepID=UPI0040585EE8